MPPTAARRSRFCRSTRPTISVATRSTAAYYVLRRVPRQLSARARQRGPRSSYIGHEAFISLVDAQYAPFPPGLRQLGLDLMCTNRDLPLSMPVGKQHTDFTIAISAPVAGIRCLVGPVAPRPCRNDGDYAWRFTVTSAWIMLNLVDSDELRRRRGIARAAAAVQCRRRRFGGGAPA